MNLDLDLDLAARAARAGAAAALARFGAVLEVADKGSGADPVSMINRMTGSRVRSLVTKSQPVNPGSRRSLITRSKRLRATRANASSALPAAPTW